MNPKNKEEAIRRFRYVAPSNSRIPLRQEVGRIFQRAIKEAVDVLPDSRETSLTITKLEEARMWANASVALNITDSSLVPRPTLLLIRGLPGSGKSYLAEEIRLMNMSPESVGPRKIASDDFPKYYHGETYFFRSTLLGEAHEWCKRVVLGYFVERIPFVIVHNTFSRLWEMEFLTDLGIEYGYQVKVIDLGDSGLTNELLASVNNHGCPVEKIADMRMRWEPGLPEGASAALPKDFGVQWSPWRPSGSESPPETR